jgi:hypothetical protein
MCTFVGVLARAHGYTDADWDAAERSFRGGKRCARTCPGTSQGQRRNYIFCTNLSCFVLPTRLSRLRATRVPAARQKLEAIVRSTFSAQAPAAASAQCGPTVLELRHSHDRTGFCALQPFPRVQPGLRSNRTIRPVRGRAKPRMTTTMSRPWWGPRQQQKPSSVQSRYPWNRSPAEAASAVVRNRAIANTALVMGYLLCGSICHPRAASSDR